MATHTETADCTTGYVQHIAPAPYRSPRYIPTLVNGVSGDDCPLPSAYFCWLNSADQERYALELMGDGIRPQFRLVQGDTVAKTKEIAEKLWRSPHAANFVDTAKNCIRIGVDVLAYRDLQAHLNWRATQVLNEDARRNATLAEHEARIDSLGVRGIKPVVMNVNEVRERAAHAAREDRPFVGASGTQKPAKSGGN